ncbi:MAG: hypothetical protein AAF938_27650 [Myxococcota bacterium]
MKAARSVPRSFLARTWAVLIGLASTGSACTADYDSTPDEFDDIETVELSLTGRTAKAKNLGPERAAPASKSYARLNHEQQRLIKNTADEGLPFAVEDEEWEEVSCTVASTRGVPWWVGCQIGDFVIYCADENEGDGWLCHVDTGSD